MAYLTIIAMGLFGLVIAAVSHLVMARERRAILSAQGQLMARAEENSKTDFGSMRAVKSSAASALSHPTKGRTVRYVDVRLKHYTKRVSAKES